MRDLGAAVARLEAHVADLESRKRAPLYQKRQEEELAAAVEKAAEAEARATSAEGRAKDAKACCPDGHMLAAYWTKREIHKMEWSAIGADAITGSAFFCCLHISIIYCKSNLVSAHPLVLVSDTVSS